MRDALNINKTNLNLVLSVISFTIIIMIAFMEQNYFKIISQTNFEWTLYYDGYSISSKGFLPTVVDTMVI